MQSQLIIHQTLTNWRNQCVIIGQLGCDEHVSSQKHLQTQTENLKNSITTTASIHTSERSSSALGPLQSIEETIESIFQRLEEVWSHDLISHIVCYLCCSRYGLSETELLDLLSLDEDALYEVYSDLPSPIRFPYPVWKAIAIALGKSYIVCL